MSRRVVPDEEPLWRALADPTRRAILDELQERSGQTLFELCTRLMSRHGLSSSRQAVSQHLDVLEDAGLVRTRREGRFKFHSLDAAPLERLLDRWLQPGHHGDQGTQNTTDSQDPQES